MQPPLHRPVAMGPLHLLDKGYLLRSAAMLTRPNLAYCGC